MHDAILDSDATALAEAISSRALTVRALAEAFLARIAERDALIQAWAYIDPDLVRDQADRLDGGSVRGPLHGVPIAIKDVLATHDMPTGNGSPLYQGHRVKADAAAVRLLRQAGALILGKTSTVELASVGQPPPTRNPHAPDHTPGGSSSGSAAAVADRQAPLALGTQTGGSIIRPASYCGVWALKPSWGSVSTEGTKVFAPTLDTIGWFGRSARDLALLLDVMTPMADIEPPPEIQTLRIGLWRTPGWDRALPETQAALSAIAVRLLSNGAAIEEVDFGDASLLEDHLTIMHGEGQRSFLPEFRRDSAKLHPRIADMVRTGPDMATLGAAYDRAASARAAFDVVASRYDALVAPSTTGAAPMGLHATGDLAFNGLLTMLHVPCINMPLHRTETRLPVGVTLCGPRFSDSRLVAIARSIEANA